MADAPVITFHWADYLVLGLFLVFSALLGVVIGFIDRKKSSSKEFMTGGGDMHWIPVALSMQASFLSAIFILSTPVEIYNFGTMYAYLGLSYFTALPISAHMFIPTFYRLKLLSAYEYLEIRFSRMVRVAGALTFCVMALLYMSVVLYTPAIALAQVTGLPVAFSIVLCGLVCTIYTVLGGMKATIWNDFIQMVIVVVGLLVIIILGAEEQGGMNKVWEENEAGGRIIFDDFNPDPTIRTNFWTQVVGGTFVSLTMYASSQTIIQKSLSVKTLRNAQKAIWLAAVTSLLALILVTVVGLIMYAHFADCDPLLNNKIDATDQMVPLLVMEVMGHLHGLPGLFIATAFSAALSSVSGSVNALSAVTLVDFIRPLYFRIKKVEVSDRASAILSRVLALIFGLITTAMGFVAQYLGDLVLQIALSIFGFVGGPLTAVLALGLFFPFVNSWGALSGLIVSLGITSWIAVGAIVANVPTPLLPMSVEGCPVDGTFVNATNMTDYYTYTQYTYTQEITAGPPPDDILWIYKVSHMYYGLIAMAIAFIVGIVVSLITGVAKDTDPKLLFMWSNECCCYCPTKVRNCFRCGAGEPRDDDDDSEIIDLEKKDIGSLGIENQGFNYVQCRELDFKPNVNGVATANVYESVDGDALAKGHIEHSTKAPHHADGGTKDSAKTEHSESRPTSNVYEDVETKSSHSSRSSHSEGGEETFF